jgi:two-component system, OmpR family, sensor histidine kinase CssS
MATASVKKQGFRLRNPFENLSLTQQLISVVLASVVVFIVFLSIFIFGNINPVIKEQLYNNLRRAQTHVMERYQRGVWDQNLFTGSEPHVTHILFRDTQPTNTNSLTQVDPELIRLFKRNIVDMSNDFERFDVSQTRTQVVYQIIKIEEGVHLVSFIPQSYMSQFEVALINGVVNILLIVVAILFLMLTLWIGYLIHSLKLIETYIDRYRKGLSAELKLDRKDEVGELARALVSMNNALRRQEQLKEEMIQNISHDLKTPIATIKSYGESIVDGVYPYETLEKSVDVIIEHANRLEKKVHSLLTLNRLGYLMENEKELVRTDMKRVIEQVILSLKVLRPRIQLKTNLTSCSYIGLEEPWRVVIENLLDNALRYAQTEVFVDLKPNYLIVYNDGVKIPEERMEQLFKPYEKGTGGQFGLGLTIVKRVLDAYNYTIKATNLDTGVQFTIYQESPHEEDETDQYL